MGTVNMTVSELKEILSSLPGDMDVIIPTNEDITDVNRIDGFRHVRTAGVLENKYEEKQALCLNTADNGLDISSQVQNHSGTNCVKILF